MNKGFASGFISSDIKSETVNTKNGDMKKIRFSIACNRKTKGEADFPWFVAFGKTAEHIEQFFGKGRGIYVEYKIQTGKYTNKEGKTIFTEDKVITEFEFPPIRKDEEQQTEPQPQTQEQPSAPDEGFIDIPEGIEDSLPFR
jgi:single-strand DNA-binding protein